MSDILLKQYNLLPKEFQKEVQNYIEYLLFRAKRRPSEKPESTQSDDFTTDFRMADSSDTKTTIREIQDLFTYDKGWASEEEMLADMAAFRRKRSV